MPRKASGDSKIDELSEADLARYFEERKGDVSLREKTPSKIRVRRGGPSTIFSLRLAPEELEEIHAAAARRGKTISDFVRVAALRDARQDEGKTTMLEAALADVRAARACIERAEQDLQNAG